MTDDIVKRLRQPHGPSNPDAVTAADRIEALEAEVTKAKEFAARVKVCWEETEEISRNNYASWRKAEARAERLRAALESIDAVAVDFGYYEAAARTMKAIAREALEGTEL